MKIAIGSDHAAFALKEVVKKHLLDSGHEVLDMGTYSPERADYPVYGEKVAKAVINGDAKYGVAICGTGAGISITANKVPGIRCVLASEPYTAVLSRRHNDANMLAMGARVVGEGLACMIVDQFLEAEFEGGRHADRVALITKLDQNRDSKKTILS
ncbi:ribose 5-phosphate isomerase B [Leptolinea tardivitalis]|uniref:Ribose 5-phosphate isomerase n=1 Tax=Leptolinea tardivitalis TaxID=229920 RepID=A0A0N8GKP0_9CHLR|nr:ribose 5-phosphate isomerase B [Leptolinea tardivitalis]KPL70234.1 ribose 5-phosphate isomerase [Leptolinea tardivitalis]GAP21780.1 ribose-5-phosphate isomerase [Leptolinea tardivitalis]